MCFSWTNVPLFNQTVWHLLIFNNCGHLEQGFFVKKKKSNSFAMCQAQFTYKLIGNTVCNNFIIWPDNDNGSQLFIRNWICLSSLNLCVTVWFWNLAGSSKQPLGGKLWLEYSFWLKLYNETSTCATWNMGFYANPVLWNLYEAFLPSIPCTS